jgi:uncharacterized protein YbjT (DUF2867 family)
MRVLVTGANGFIGGHVVAALLAAGHEPVGCVRDPEAWRRRWPGRAALPCDFNRDTAPENWRPRLEGIDAVVNAAGILSERGGQSHAKVHVEAPAALFEACRRAGVRRVIHISALGADEAAGTGYARSKRVAEAALAATDLDWVILRPSLVYGGAAYGGTALMRGFAALPFAVPLVGDGSQRFSPLHMDDLTRAICRFLEPGAPARLRLDAAGPEARTLREILAGMRSWLGLAPARFVRVPVGLAALACRFGDALGWATVNGTALRMLRYGNVADGRAFREAAGFAPRGFAAGLARQPATTQDRWHARLVPVRPALRWLLALVWLVSGGVGLLPASIDYGAGLLERAGVPRAAGAGVLYAACLLDLALGAALLLRWRVKLAGAVALALALGYPFVLTVLAPATWADPLGALIKNLAIAGGTLAMLAIEDDR